jgi:hypothetical protein
VRTSLAHSLFSFRRCKNLTFVRIPVMESDEFLRSPKKIGC